MTFVGNEESRLEHRAIFEKLDAMPDGISEGDNLKKLLIVATPRCGSTLFCDILNGTNKMGLCDEWYNFEYFRAYCDVHGIDRNEFDITRYMKYVIRKSIRGTGVFTMKTHVGQLIHVGGTFDISKMSFFHGIYLYRKNKIAQAISLLKAEKTNQWRFDQQPDETDFDIKTSELLETLFRIATTEETATKIFNMDSADKYAYEDFRNIVHPCYNEVLVKMGKTPSDPSKFTTDLKIQRGFKSAKIEREFRQYITGESQCDN